MSEPPGAGFGPWVPRLPAGERRARWRALRALATVFAGPASPLVAALHDAETDRAAARRALKLLDAVPPLPRRRILSLFALVHAPDPNSSTVTKSGGRPQP